MDKSDDGRWKNQWQTRGIRARSGGRLPPRNTQVRVDFGTCVIMKRGSCISRGIYPPGAGQWTGFTGFFRIDRIIQYFYQPFRNQDRGADSMIKKTFRVTGMQCPNCAMQIEGLEDELDGIVSIRASYPKASVVIEFDESKINLSRIFESVGRKGYTLEEIL
jgi:copper chaperone CopZ